MNRKLLFASVFIASVVAGFALATPMAMGGVIITSKQTLPTCSATLEGGEVRAKGGGSEGYTKICYCVSDGAATPAYQWCSIQFGAGAATTTCAGGSNTVCP